MTDTNINPDLQKDRQRASFNPEVITNLLEGGSKNTKRRRYLDHVIRSDPTFSGPDPRFLSRQEQFMEALRKQVALVKKVKELGIRDQREVLALNDSALDGGLGPLAMHATAFLPPVRLLSDEEQKKKWLPLAENYDIIGCYAQTELGHGTFVRGIETRADYDIRTKEFVLNSPTLSSTKWWIGTLGVCATHALVMAQLYTRGKSHGLHPFIVPIRCTKTHKPLTGVSVGDIGPKFGFATMDNGFLHLTNVRIPRDNLLRKAGQVLDDGTYSKPKSGKLVYGGMLGIRAQLPIVAARNLAKACTIAIRYSSVRRQSELKPGDSEPQVLDYQTQQHKLFPLLAGAYAYWFVGLWMIDFHSQVLEEMHKEDFSRLAEVHVLAAGLKALSNWKSHEGVELCRLSCGGHGYSQASGLPQIYVGQVANSTAEGETIILLMQTGKYLVKCFMDVQQGKSLDPSVKYLTEKDVRPPSGDFSLQSLRSAFQFRSRKCSERLGMRLQKILAETGDQSAALNQNTVLLTEAAKAHIEAVVMNAFVVTVDRLSQTSPKEADALGLLCHVYGITEILGKAGDYLQYNYISQQQLGQLQEQLFSLYDKLRPEAIGLVDAFDFTDAKLGSILGRYDGQVYEKMYEWAKASPLNKEEVHESFRKYLQPLKQASKL